MTTIFIVDRDSKRGREVARIVRAGGGDPKSAMIVPPTQRLVIGHASDLVEIDAFADGARIVAYSGGHFSVDEPGWYRFPRHLDRERAIIGDVEADLSRVVAWLLDASSEVPAFLLPSTELLAPIVPLGILLDGWIALTASGKSVPQDWFASGIAAALAASQPRKATVDDARFWDNLGTDAAAIEQLGRILDGEARETPRMREIFASARERWTADPRAICKGAAADLARFWDALRSSSTVDPAAAHVAYQLLAAVHL